MTAPNNNTSTTPGLMPVTQADRNAAADVWRDMIAKRGECIAEKQIRAGGAMDALPLTQAFARHRELSEQREADQEPVAWMYTHGGGDRVVVPLSERAADMTTRGWTETPLYAVPPTPVDRNAVLEEAARLFLQLERSIKIDIGSCHKLRGAAASSAMREDDRDMRRDVEAAFDALRAALRTEPAAQVEEGE